MMTSDLNTDIREAAFQHMLKLPKHLELFRNLMDYFSKMNGIEGAFISGSGAVGGMDSFSDLDLGFVCSSEAVKEKIWSERFNWPLPAWFHRMDADHVKPYFIIYLFEPDIHVDLCFYTTENLPPRAGGPYAIAFDKKNQLQGWLAQVNQPLASSPDWSNVVHEDERMWTWIHYAWCHVGRGEYYDIAADFAFLRSIPHSWYSRLKNENRFNSRRLELRGETDFIESMKLCYPRPEKTSVKAALLNLIAVHNAQRFEVDRLLKPHWKTTPAARDKITRLVNEL